MNGNFKNYSEQGNMGLGEAISYYVSIMNVVSIPLNDCQKYDLVVDNGILSRVSVKTSSITSKNGYYKVSLRTISGKKDLGWCKDCSDIIFIVCANGVLYEIPTVELIKYNSNVTLSSKFDKFIVIKRNINFYLK